MVRREQQEIADRAAGTAVTAVRHLLALIFLLLAVKVEPVDKTIEALTPQALVQLGSTTAAMAVKVDLEILGAVAAALAAGLWFPSRNFPVPMAPMHPAAELMALAVRRMEL